MHGLYTAIVNREFFEIGQDADRECADHHTVAAETRD